VGIPTSQGPDTPEGLESRLYVRIHRIQAELPHSTKLELRKLRRTRMDSGRASALELLRGLLTSQEVLHSSEPRLSLNSIKIEFLEAHWGGGLNLTFFTPSIGGSTVVFIGGGVGALAKDWVREAHLSSRPAMQLGRAAKFPSCTAFGHWIP
jgi:hypothetical protein